MNHFRFFSGFQCVTLLSFLSMGVGFRSLTCQKMKTDQVDDLVMHEYDQSLRADDAIVQPRTRQNAYGTVDSLEEALWRPFVGDRDRTSKRVPAYNASCSTVVQTQIKNPGSTSQGVEESLTASLIKKNLTLEACVRR